MSDAAHHRLVAEKHRAKALEYDAHSAVRTNWLLSAVYHLLAASDASAAEDRPLTPEEIAVVESFPEPAPAKKATAPRKRAPKTTQTKEN